MRFISKASSLKVLSALAVAGTALATSGSAWAQNAPPAPAAPPPPAADTAVAQPAHAPSSDQPAERTANNALYIEGLGPAVVYSINYDRTFDKVAARVGMEYFSLSATDPNTGSSSSATFLAVPITVSYLGIGSLKHMLELGGGGTIMYFGGAVNTLGSKTTGSSWAGAGTLIAGYRYQPPDGGFFLRAGISPLLISAGGGFLPWPYLGLGATF